MGLREMKVARTRAQIADVAVELFVVQGYEETTMDQIAEAAEIGSSTLYRYFPSKELLILEPFAEVFDYARYLRARPVEEPIDLALGHALMDQATEFSRPDRRIADMRRIIDAHPVPRARLWDLILQSRAGFEAAVAERMSLSPTATAVQVTVGFAFDLISVVDLRWKSDHAQNYAALLREAIEERQAVAFVVPRLM